MKPIYYFSKPILVLSLLLISFCFVQKINAQCNCPAGEEPNTVVFTEVAETSLEVTNFRFPQFDATLGTLACVTVNAAITSVVRIRLENDEIYNLIYNVRYERSATINGLGLNTGLVHSFAKNYGPFNLAASDGETFSGPDFVQTPHDTVLKQQILRGVISHDITGFLGTDSVNYEYLLSGRSTISGGGNYLGGPQTKDYINLQLIYTYCTPMLLSNEFTRFQIEKGKENLLLKWQIANEEDNYRYVIEVSYDNGPFNAVGQTASSGAAGSLSAYQFLFSTKDIAASSLRFRVVRISSADKRTVSAIRSVTLREDAAASLRVFPNPAKANFAVNLPQTSSGKFDLELFNLAGQRVHKQYVEGGKGRNLQISPANLLSEGTYILRLYDQETGNLYTGKIFISR